MTPWSVVIYADPRQTDLLWMAGCVSMAASVCKLHYGHLNRANPG